jgi:SAM-dependent methyltransferase
LDLLDPKPGEYIIDIGCGTGELTNEIANRVLATEDDDVATGIVFGMDADTNMIQRAQQNSFGNVIFFQGNASNFSLPPSTMTTKSTTITTVDAIFSNAALHWVIDAEAAVAHMAGVLKPGGRFVVEFGGYGNVYQIVQAANTVLNRPLDNNPWYFPRIGEYSVLLEKHGIEVTSAALFDRPTELDGGSDGMKNWLQMFGGVLLDELSSSSLSSALEIDDHVIDDIVTLLRPILYNGQTWTADYRRLRIVGQKR